MIKEELRADPLFREMLDDEREEGRKEGIQKIQEIAVALVVRDFPELESLAISDQEEVEWLMSQ